MITIALLFALQERDLFDYDGQKAAKDVRKIVLIGDAGTHGAAGNHEFIAGSLILARRLHKAYPNVHAVVHSSKNWPKDFSHADVIVVGLNHGGRAAKDPQIAAACARGAGFMAIHFGVEVNKGEQGDNYLKWMGGYFETEWSVNPWWTPSFKDFPAHPISRGVTPFGCRDEWYYHMRFVPEMKGVTPILSDVPPLATVKEQVSGRGGNPHVFKAVSEKQPQHVAWAYERPDGGRGFGFTGMHAHANWGVDGFRQTLVNALAWVAKLEIPEKGVPCDPVGPDELKTLIDEAKAAVAAGR